MKVIAEKAKVLATLLISIFNSSNTGAFLFGHVRYSAEWFHLLEYLWIQALDVAGSP